VVVTGAAGFIGSAVVRALLARGVDVVALLEPGAATSNLDGLDVRRREVDITKASQLTGAFEGVKYCFHLAAKFGFWRGTRHRSNQVNVRGSQNVVRAATDAGVERIVFTSTVATLGLWETKRGDLRMKTTSPKSRTSTGTTSRRSMSPNTKCSASPRRVPRSCSCCRRCRTVPSIIVRRRRQGRPRLPERPDARLRRHRHERRARR